MSKGTRYSQQFKDDAVTGDDPDRRRNVVHQVSHVCFKSQDV